MGDFTTWTSGASTAAGRGTGASAAWVTAVAAAICAAGERDGAAPLVTIERLTSLILNPSRSSSNSTKLLASMYSINSLISLSNSPPPMRDLLRLASRGGPRGPGARDPKPASYPNAGVNTGGRGMAPASPGGASGDDVLQLPADLPGLEAGPPRDSVRADHQAQIVVPPDRPQDRQPRSAGDGNLLQAIGAVR